MKREDKSYDWVGQSHIDSTGSRRRLLWLLVILAFLHLVVTSAPGQDWDWSPAAKHHQAIVEVRSGDRGTSGIYLQHGELLGVLTVAHGLARDTATVTFADGTKRTGPATIDKFRHDLAWVFVEHPQLSPLRLADATPTVGQRVEFVTYGGPQNGRLRHFFAKITGAEGKVTRYDCRVVSGDSGGAILNDRHEVIGVQANARTKLSKLAGWPVYDGAASAGWRPVRDFLGRVAERCREGCPEGWCPAPRDGDAGAGRELLYPPLGPPRILELPKPESPAPNPEPPSIGSPDASRLDLQPGPPAPSTPPAMVDRPSTPEPEPQIEYEKLAALMFARVEANADKFRGLPGGDGKDGRDGAAGQRGMRGLAGIAGEVADGGLLGKTVSTALTALGWTAPPSIAMLGGLWLFRRILARRRKRGYERRTEVPSPTATNTGPQSIFLGWDDGPNVRSTRNRYIRVEQTDAEGESYKEAIASWAETNPKTAGLLKAIEQLAQNIHHGKRVAARMRPEIDNPQIHPQNQGVL